MKVCCRRSLNSSRNMASADQPCLLNDLPDEILLKIFTKLLLSDLILSARSVCKRWLRLSKDESLWIKVDLSTLFLGSEHNHRTKNAKGVEALLFDIQDCVEKITFNNVPLESETYELFCCSPRDSLDICFQKLRSLDYSYSTVSLCQLRRALSTYSSITELILVHTNIVLADVVTEAIHLPHLKKLIFHDIHAWENFLDHPQDFSRNINSRSLLKVPKHCPQLEWVEFYTMWAEFDDSVINQFIRFCPLLRRLYFTWSPHLTEEGFQNSKQHNSVTHLGFADRHGQGAFLTYILPHFPHLVSLTVDGYQVYDEDCITIGKCCPKLQELIFDVKDFRYPINVFFLGLHQTNAFLCSAKLQEIVQHCKFLSKIHAACSKVDDEGFLYLVKHCPLLEDINFMCCSNLTEKCLQMLSKHCPKLKSVNFQYTFTSHEDVHSLLSSCPHLHEVILDRKSSDDPNPSRPSSLVTSSNSLSPLTVPEPSKSFSSAVHPSQYDYEELPYIDMESSQEQEEELCQLQATNPEESSSASQHDAVPPKDLNLSATSDSFLYFPVLPDHCHLSTLSLKHSNLSSCALQQIFQLCPDLTHVDLDGCVGLKNETIQFLLSQCQNMKVLKMSARQDSPCYIGDEALREICKYSRNLEEISILHNHNISTKSICCILGALDSSLRQLRSFSFCIGINFKCKAPLPEVHWLKYLSKRSAISLEEATGSRENDHYRILHLEFIHRRHKDRM